MPRESLDEIIESKKKQGVAKAMHFHFGSLKDERGNKVKPEEIINWLLKNYLNFK